MTIVKLDETVFDCITQEANRQRLKRPEHVEAINTAEKKIRVLVMDGKLEENHMLVEFSRALQGILAPRVSPRTLQSASKYASK